ncbi:MAG: hypothetical protein GY861_28350 [bacterium]|nr:hypothetical protein [bacterium]
MAINVPDVPNVLNEPTEFLRHVKLAIEESVSTVSTLQSTVTTITNSTSASTLRTQIAEGKAFATNHSVNLEVNETLNILAITANNALIVTLGDSIDSFFETKMEVYTGTTVTSNGEELTLRNRNERSSNSATMSAYHSPTITSDGTLVYTTRWLTGNKPGAIRILAPNQTYMFRITSTSSGNWITHELYITEDT